MYTMAPSCDSGAAVDSSGAVGSSRHLVGAESLPGTVSVGGGRGRGVGGRCGETVGSNTAVHQQALLPYKTFTLKLYVTLYYLNFVH